MPQCTPSFEGASPRSKDSALVSSPACFGSASGLTGVSAVPSGVRADRAGWHDTWRQQILASCQLGTWPQSGAEPTPVWSGSISALLLRVSGGSTRESCWCPLLRLLRRCQRRCAALPALPTPPPALACRHCRCRYTAHMRQRCLPEHWQQTNAPLPVPRSPRR